MESITVPVSVSSTSIPRFLDHIRSAGVPAKVTTAYLKSAGFKSSNDHSLLKIFKDLGFLSSDGTPTDIWRSYRADEQQAKIVLGHAINYCYAGLFHL